MAWETSLLAQKEKANVGEYYTFKCFVKRAADLVCRPIVLADDDLHRCNQETTELLR
ncbi:uncharacterized protein METZ01_LOCUS267253 [marine metagenome]|uniref:Uncharacterized protein n=1 Tax=marine metagenome TaxID=408172 RepID=A0A382JRM4_9ZZZZ